MTIVCILLAALMVFAAVLLLRALAFRPEAQSPVSAPEEALDGGKAVRDLQALIRCKTVSYRDKALEDDREFAHLEALLPELFPHVHAVCAFEKPGPRSLLFHWKGRSDAAPGVLMAHYDVVPVNEEM